METIYELIKKHSAGKGEEMMWKTTEVISEAIKHGLPEDYKVKLYNELYGLLSDGHYNEAMAEADIAKMYYVDEDDEKHYAPYFTAPAVKDEYTKIKSMIPDYNEWDFAVTLNMVASDNHNLIMKWFPESTAESRLEKYVEMAVNWLHDQDWPETDKIWAYLH